MVDRREWVQLRDAHNRLQAEYNPATNRLIIRSRGETTEYDLSRYRSKDLPVIHLQEQKNVLQSL
ncbi:MAG: hypothetical protein U0350_36295 [Caldilineaceae bacterium]